jgi:hypothetical protein
MGPGWSPVTASGGADWDPATGITRHTLTGHTNAVRPLVIAPDGSWLASADYVGERLRRSQPPENAVSTSWQSKVRSRQQRHPRALSVKPRLVDLRRKSETTTHRTVTVASRRPSVVVTGYAWCNPSVWRALPAHVLATTDPSRALVRLSLKCRGCCAGPGTNGRGPAAPPVADGAAIPTEVASAVSVFHTSGRGVAIVAG